MITHLTSEEFVDLFFTRLERKMTNCHQAGVGDHIIWSMFQHYKKDVRETLEGSMWNIDQFTGDNAIDLIGHQFHKSFRQTDVIPAQHIDGIVWTCMQDAPIFWKCLKKACDVLTDQKAAEAYRELELE